MDAIYASEATSRRLSDREEVIAIKYVAVSVVKDAEGVGVYSYVFHLRTASGATYSLGARYSVFRRLSKVLFTEQPEACAMLPPFPPKHSMRRQTPAFLLARGKALEAYISAALGNARLSGLPAVRELLRMADLHEPVEKNAPAPALTSTPAGLNTLSPSPGPGLRQWQRSSVKMRSVAARSNAAADASAVPTFNLNTANGTATADRGGSSLVAFTLHPSVALLVAGALGYFFAQLTLCLSCCVVGMVMGQLWQALPSPSTPTNGGKGVSGGGNGHSNGETKRIVSDAPNGNGAAAGGGGGQQGPADGVPVVVGRATDELAPGNGTGHETPSESDLAYGREAALAVAILEDAARCEVSAGWTHFATKEEVEIYLNARPDGSTWCMGVGNIRKPPEEVSRGMEDPAHQMTLDKSLLKTNVFRQLPTSACTIDGWEVRELTLQQGLYKSVAFPIAARETCVVKVHARRIADGAIRTCLRSVEIEGVKPPSGYVRATVGCGGYECAQADQASTGLTRMTYVNVLNPNGMIPKSIVNVKVPERALTVARLRQCVEGR